MCTTESNEAPSVPCFWQNNGLAIKETPLSLVSIYVVRIASIWMQTRFLSFSHMPWSSHSCIDHRYSYFTRNFRNRCINSLKILFGATSEACSAIVTTIWRPGFNSQLFETFSKLSMKIVVEWLKQSPKCQLCDKGNRERNPLYIPCCWQRSWRCPVIKSVNQPKK